MGRPRISFKEKKLSLTPDPIIVKRGELIEIELFADLTHSDYSISDFLKFKKFKWKLHFKNRNPFDMEQHSTLEFETLIREAPIHSGIATLGVAENYGEYKFDISLISGSDRTSWGFQEEDSVIEEVDPIISVV